MTEKIITARSSFTMRYDHEFPYHLAVVHDDGYVNDKKWSPASNDVENSIYFSEHDGQSIGPAVELLGALCGPLYIPGAKLNTHGEYTGTGDTSKSVWLESSDTDALKALDGKTFAFWVEEKLELIDGEWEPRSITYKVATNIYKAEQAFNY
jgi:hypothetical protein